jgi:hypothetical protein
LAQNIRNDFKLTPNLRYGPYFPRENQFCV